jgi:hypothetical protein
MVIGIPANSWLPRLVAGLLISGPAIAMLLYVYQSGLVADAEASNRASCKRFILLTTLTQLWVMLLWSILLFRLGLQNA